MNWWAVAAFVAVAMFVAPRTASGMRLQRFGYTELQRLTPYIEPYIPGYGKFALAVAKRESAGNNLALNKSDGKAACSGYERQAHDRFKANPYPKYLFCAGSGGWFGLIPSTALAAPGFENADPRLIFHPAASVILFADYIRRLGPFLSQLPSGQRNWLAVRRFMAGNTVGFDWQEQKVLNSDTDGVPRATKVRLRLAEDLQAWGIPSSFMYQPVVVHNWPGALALAGGEA